MNIKNMSLNSNHLKLIAILAMTIDHLTDLLYPNYPIEPIPLILHFIGRLTAPIMWFFIVEGFHYTKNVKKYILRLGAFALISHFAYCFGFGIDPLPFKGGIFNQTSVMYPLFIAVVILWLLSDEVKLNPVLKFLISFCLVWSAFPANWSCIAVLAILSMNEKRGNLKGQMLSMCLWVFLYGIVSYFFVSKAYALELIGVLLVYPILKRYNGERGKVKWMKWFFYAYYPAHLIIIGICRIILYGNINIGL